MTKPAGPEPTPCECCRTNDNPGFKHGGKCVDCGHTPRSHAHAFAKHVSAGPEELIERALTITDDRMGGYHATKWRQREAIEALAAAGLLADPEQRGELQDAFAELEGAFATVCRERDHAVADARQWQRAAEERNGLARKVADLRDEVATARQETDDVRESHGLVVSDRDKLSIKLEDVTIALRGDADFKPVLVNPAVDQIQALRAERDQLQARIDLMNKYMPHAERLIRDAEADRAALQGDQPAPVLPGDETPQPEEDQP